MKQISESTVKQEVKDLLAQQRYADDIWTNWPVPMGYGIPMLDCIGSYRGRAFAIETKRPGEHMTPRQEFTRGEMEKGGVTVFCIGEKVTYDENGRHFSGMQDLILWLESL